jgi:hypothetical protein
VRAGSFLILKSHPQRKGAADKVEGEYLECVYEGADTHDGGSANGKISTYTGKRGQPQAGFEPTIPVFERSHIILDLRQRGGCDQPKEKKNTLNKKKEKFNLQK